MDLPSTEIAVPDPLEAGQPGNGLRGSTDAPALGVAGILTIASAVGVAASQAKLGGVADWQNLVLVMALGAIAAGAARPPRRSNSAAAWLLLLGVAGAGRAAIAPTTLRPSAGAGPAHRTGERTIGRATRNFRHLARRGEVDWRLDAPATPGDGPTLEASVRTSQGAIREGETIALLPSAASRWRARSLWDAPQRPPLSRRPLADEILRLRPGPGGWVSSGAAPVRALRRAGVEEFGKLEDPTTSGLLAALLFGETGYLPPGVADLFTRTGTRHMLALSGLHVGILGVVIALPLARLLCALAGFAAALVGRHWRPSPAVAAAGLALAFIPLAGQGAPAARAAMALALASLASRWNRRAVGLNLVGVALVLEIALDPIAPLRAGVQLSYLATAALIAAAPQTARRMLAPMPGGGKVRATWPSGRRRSPWLRVLCERAQRVTAIALATSLVASVATLPVVWTRFGEFSPVGMIATPLAFPPLVILVVGGWAWLACSALASGSVAASLASAVARALEATAGEMLSLLSWADRAPWSPLPLPERSLLWLSSASLLILIGLRRSMHGRGWPLRLGVACYGIALLPGSHGGALEPRVDELQVHVLDVGNGTAVVVRAPGEPTWIVDAGSRDRVGVARNAVAPLLRSVDVGRLAVSLSHDDSDHAAALPWIVRRWPAQIWVGPRPTLNEAPGVDADPLDGAPRVPLLGGARRVTRAGAALQILAVHGGDFDGNEGSSMLDVRWTPPHRRARPGKGGATPRPFRIILSGDAEGHGLAAMLQGTEARPASLEPGPVDALLLPHHGSATSHLGWLLDHLQPREVWVSGSALPVSLAEFARRGIPVRSTAEIGPFRWAPSSLAAGATPRDFGPD